MGTVTYQRNRRWLSSKAEQYPHACMTAKNYPDPREVKRRIPQIDFVCAPLVRFKEWRFLSVEDMLLFKGQYVTEDNRNAHETGSRSARMDS